MRVSEFSADISVDNGVFFNGKMCALRSISAAFVRSFAGKGSRLIDATAATGVRGIRYALESGIDNPVLIDMNKKAYENAAKNVRANSVRAEVLNVSFQEFANACGERFDIIDVDPFGSPAPMIYDAFKIAKNGTLLMVTATDTAVLCGAHRNACLKIYGAVPLHTELCKEAGMRILLGYIATNAAQFNFGIEPLMCISDMHYMRIFARVSHGAADALASVKGMGFAGQCSSCRSFSYGNGISAVSRVCARCGSGVTLSGRMWLGKLCSAKAIGKVSEAAAELADKDAAGLLGSLSKELDLPFFYSVPRLTRMLSIGAVSHKKVMSRLIDAGKTASGTQYCKDSVKTDAGYESVISAVTG